MQSEIPPSTPAPTEEFAEQRQRMVATQIKDRGVMDLRVLQAMRQVPRHVFVPFEQRALAYHDHPLAIGFEQTISQPYIVAYMTEQLRLTGQEKVLEIGTGSGYQAAVLAELVKHVYTMEIIRPLCEEAEQRLKTLHYHNITVRCGDGYAGWPEAAPFDAIILTAAPPSIPEALVKQLAAGGRMILPLGESSQELILITKRSDGTLKQKSLIPVRFVPMTGQAATSADSIKKK